MGRAKSNGDADGGVAIAEECASCGQQLGANTRFCAFCGAARKAGSGWMDLTDIQVVVADAGDTQTAEEPAEHLVTGEATVPFTLDTPTPTPRRSMRRILIPAVVLVIALVAGAIALFGRGGPGYDLDATLTTLSARSADVWSGADRASTLDQLTSSGAVAKVATTELTTLRAELVDVSNDDDRRAAEAAFDAHIGSLEALSELADLDAAKVAEWPDVAADIDVTVKDLIAAQKQLVERELVGSPDLANAVNAASGRLDVALASISDKLGTWASEVARINADKGAQKKALDDYTAAFRANMERYAGLRSGLAQLVEQLTNESGTFSNAYADLGAAAAQRREVHAAMSALVPPSALVPSHTAIVSAVQDSATAVQSAITGLEEFQYDYYYEIETTPGWQTFSRMSDQISSTYNGAVGSWDAAVVAEEARIAGITTPARPPV